MLRSDRHNPYLSYGAYVGMESMELIFEVSCLHISKEVLPRLHTEATILDLTMEPLLQCVWQLRLFEDRLQLLQLLALSASAMIDSNRRPAGVTGRNVALGSHFF